MPMTRTSTLLEKQKQVRSISRYANSPHHGSTHSAKGGKPNCQKQTHISAHMVGSVAGGMEDVKGKSYYADNTKINDGSAEGSGDASQRMSMEEEEKMCLPKVKHVEREED